MDDAREWLARAKSSLKLASADENDPEIDLEERCFQLQQAPEIGNLKSAATRLTSYAALTHYPPTMEMSESDADSALADASLVLETCTAHIRNLRSTS